MTPSKPIVLITGASGNLGRSVAKALMDQYQIVGLDREASAIATGAADDFPALAVDFWDDVSVVSALQAFRAAYGSRIPSVILHLAGVYDAHTMAQQMARIYARELQSHLYSGSTLVGHSTAASDGLNQQAGKWVDAVSVFAI